MMNRNSIRRIPESKKIMAAIIACVIVIAAVLGVVLFTTSEASAYSQKLKLAEQYVTEGDLEAAEIQYKELINLYPKREQAYIDLAEKVYVRQNRYEEAFEILQKGRENTGKVNVFDDTIQRITQEQKDSAAWKNAYSEILRQYADGIYAYENWSAEYHDAREGTALCDLNEDGVDELLFFTMADETLETLHIFTYLDGAAKEITYNWDSSAGDMYEHDTGERFEAVQVAGGTDYVIYKENGRKGFTAYSNISDESMDCVTNRYEMDAACSTSRTDLVGMWFLLYDVDGDGNYGPDHATYYKDHKKTSRDEYYGIMDASTENVQTVIFRFSAQEWFSEENDFDFEHPDHPSLWENTSDKAVSIYYEDMLERLAVEPVEAPPAPDGGMSDDGKNMEALLKAYGSGDYDTAFEINEKLPKYVTEMSVSEDEAEAYDALYEDMIDKEMADEFTLHYVTDVDNDGNAEYLLQVGTCEADYRLRVYQYRDGKVQEVGEEGFGHSWVCQYPDHNGIVIVSQHMGAENLFVVSIENGKLKRTAVGERGGDDYIELGCALDFYEY